MRAHVATGVLAVALMLGGCAASGPDESPSPDLVQTLWSARTDFVGENSHVADLVERAGFGTAGTYSLALETRQSPYAMNVAFVQLDKPFDSVDFSSEATLLLGLIANLDQVSVTLDDHSYSLTAADASTALGYDVKDLGRDKSKLAAFLDHARD